MALRSSEPVLSADSGLIVPITATGKALKLSVIGELPGGSVHMSLKTRSSVSCMLYIGGVGFFGWTEI